MTAGALMLHIFAGSRGPPAAREVAERVIGEVQAFSGEAGQRDGITVVALRRR